MENGSNKWARGDLIEMDGLVGAVIAIGGADDVPDDHVGVWFAGRVLRW